MRSENPKVLLVGQDGNSGDTHTKPEEELGLWRREAKSENQANDDRLDEGQARIDVKYGESVQAPFGAKVLIAGRTNIAIRQLWLCNQ